MPRAPRIELAGGIHHVTNRGTRKQRIFHDDADRSFFLRALRRAAAWHRWTCLSHCLMPNHFHLVVETPEPTLGAGMHQLGSHYAHEFNRRHGTGGGHLFQSRFGSVLVRSDEQFAQLLRYVALNPVKAGLCDDPARWRWSSHRELLCDSDARARLEELLERWGGEPGTRYAHLFEPGHVLEARYGSDDPWTHRPPLEELLRGENADHAMRAAREHGYPLREIAAAVGVAVSTVSRRTRRAN